MGCNIKVTKKGFLAFKLYWNGMESWEGTKLPDTAENRRFLEAKAVIISREIEHGTFDYLSHFPNGNKAHVFTRTKKVVQPETVRSYFENWIPRQKNRVRSHRLKDYKSQFKCHILLASIDSQEFGDIYLSALAVHHLEKLQTHLRAKGLKANSVNGIVHGSLKAMLKDARRSGALTVNLFDRDLFSSLPLTDVEEAIDPYTPQERELIIEGFRRKPGGRPYFAFVFHQFWTGARPSETCALRRGDIDLAYGWERIEKSLVQGDEAGTKTKRSNRQVRLHENLAEVLKEHLRFQLDPQEHAFKTPRGAPIDESNFYKRHWLVMLRRLKIRPRPFRNTRHSYASFMLSCGHSLAFISAQTGDNEKTLKAHYAKYMPDVDRQRDLVEASIRESEARTRTEIFSKLTEIFSEGRKGKRVSSGKVGAGEEGRTPDLMLGKHTL
jgi:integrase